MGGLEWCQMHEMFRHPEFILCFRTIPCYLCRSTPLYHKQQQLLLLAILYPIQPLLEPFPYGLQTPEICPPCWFDSHVLYITRKSSSNGERLRSIIRPGYIAKQNKMAESKAAKASAEYFQTLASSVSRYGLVFGSKFIKLWKS